MAASLLEQALLTGHTSCMVAYAQMTMHGSAPLSMDQDSYAQLGSEVGLGTQVIGVPMLSLLLLLLLLSKAGEGSSQLLEQLW